MRGVVVLTDWDWFQFLSGQQVLDEVNFWRPVSLQKPTSLAGTPYIFKLNAKRGGKIVGYGIFAWHSVKPAWLVWDAFGIKNGAATFAEMHRLVSDIRGSKGLDSDPAGSYEVGCLMLSSPVFFERDAWIEPPRDWPKSGVMFGKSYDLTEGEGARVWQECLTRTPRAVAQARPGDLFDRPDGPRYGAPSLVAPRLGQGAFRFAVSDAYGGACAVTGEHSLPVLEAAHIRPYANNGPHRVANGLLLRTDVHRLFDLGYLTVTPGDLCVRVSPRLNTEFGNGRVYYEMEDKCIALPAAAELRPRDEFLEWHVETVFRR